MVSDEVAMDCIQRLSLQRYFPAQDYAPAMLMAELQKFCIDDAMAQKITAIALRECEEWVTLAGLREMHRRYADCLDDPLRPGHKISH